MIMDSTRTHGLTHEGVSGELPMAMTQASGQLMENFAAGIILGGRLQGGMVNC